MEYDLRPYNGFLIAGLVRDSRGWSVCATFSPYDLEWIRAWVRKSRALGFTRYRNP